MAQSVKQFIDSLPSPSAFNSLCSARRTLEVLSKLVFLKS
jgi:hypothetical protein